MSSLKFAEKQNLENFLEMGGGYVLDFSNRTFQEFIYDGTGIDIYNEKYEDDGDSKAKRLRCFWEKENDDLVGNVLKMMLEYSVEQGSKDRTNPGYIKVQKVVQRLLHEAPETTDQEVSEDDFLKQEFKNLSVDTLPIEASVIPILKDRFKETEQCYRAEANLAAIILCGSILEGVLFGLSQAFPKEFNTAKSVPMVNSKPKPFHQWKLAELIQVAHEIGALKYDVKKFSEHLRDFRNYVHPYQQLATNFSPDKHTAEICLTVLKAAVHQITNWSAKAR